MECVLIVLKKMNNVLQKPIVVLDSFAIWVVNVFPVLEKMNQAVMETVIVVTDMNAKMVHVSPVSLFAKAVHSMVILVVNYL